MFKEEYIWNGWVNKGEVNANVFNTTALNLDIPVDFVFSPRLNPNSSVSETSYDVQFKVFNYWI